ncbi:phospholipase D-like domain-containing protein [Piscinibacter sp. XHJ-5]|uniref:phospholipase D-like domain-containing protein n=1 Tax=Piscinibacter sp. XHJ-5 TaxID=3037797 RepID=UPI0024533FD6|nr:phospholipase D-like domain-containing protein [Piscinibacter sp. XHJ-5]
MPTSRATFAAPTVHAQPHAGDGTPAPPQNLGESFPIMQTHASQQGPIVTIKAHRGDFKTLLAFNLVDESHRKNLAGFTVQCRAPSGKAFYLHNALRFEDPSRHAQCHTEPDNSSINAPLHTFRWLHVPGEANEDVAAVAGTYQYTVTPRYFDDAQCMLPLDPALGATVSVEVGPLEVGDLQLGFTRGATQSQAFEHHFGLKALLRPAGDELLYDTHLPSGRNAEGRAYTFDEQYAWLGSTARARVLELLREATAKPGMRVDVFAYDLNEPDVLRAVLELARQGRARMLLDNAALHHGPEGKTAEDRFQKLFEGAEKGAAAIRRGKFGRYAHDKIFILYDGDRPCRVLTGSTNFSITGLYVNSNHVLVFSDDAVCKQYAQLFETVWAGNASREAFLKTELAQRKYDFGGERLPKTEITFSPHPPKVAEQLLQELADRIGAERDRGAKDGSVLFALMQVDGSPSPVYKVLSELHASQNVFSYGVSDTSKGTSLYRPGCRDGVLVCGKPGKLALPPPFDQVRDVGLGHQIHHKFVVCGFNREDAAVYCGSSNLALGGEGANGDNLVIIRDPRVATAFAIEAVALVDHFDFLDRVAQKARENKDKGVAAEVKATTSRAHAAAAASWHLGTTNKWSDKFFDKSDLRCADRLLFG